MGKQDSKISSKSGGKNGGKAKAHKSTPRLSRKDYEATLEPMLLELMQVSRWLAHCNKRLLVIFEGRDTAGKSGVIHAIASALDNPEFPAAQVRTPALLACDAADDRPADVFSWAEGVLVGEPHEWEELQRRYRAAWAG